MGRLVCLFVTCFIALSVHATGNDTALQLVKEKHLPGNYKDFYADNFGNVFLVSLNNQVKKLNQQFDSAGVFNDIRRYGDIYKLDVTNPLKILVYYRDFTTIVILDRFLNVRNTIDLRNAGIMQAKAVAQSYDNNYWVFDELNGKIKKVDDNGTVLLESPDLRILFAYEYNPQYITDTDGALYLYDTKKGWTIFDYYGAFKKRVDVTGWKDVSVNRNVLRGLDSCCLQNYNVTTFAQQQVPAGAALLNAVKIQQQLNRFFVLNNQGLFLYSTK